jgi:hypothetical protein
MIRNQLQYETGGCCQQTLHTCMFLAIYYDLHIALCRVKPFDFIGCRPDCLGLFSQKVEGRACRRNLMGDGRRTPMIHKRRISEYVLNKVDIK